jgi:putative alpha-1,2-mannosidase
MNRLYHPTPDGFCGDEDTGQMSAWYVFSAIGFYPVCPGTTEYVIGSPLFDRATITLADGKKFVINADQNGPLRPYIRDAKLNGAKFEKTYLTHEQITKGGELNFDMTSAPNYKWATAPESRPGSAMRLLQP